MRINKIMMSSQLYTVAQGNCHYSDILTGCHNWPMQIKYPREQCIISSYPVILFICSVAVTKALFA